MGKRFHTAITFIVCMALTVTLFIYPLIITESQLMNDDELTSAYGEDQTWIIKWKQTIDPAFIANSEIIEHIPEFDAVVARPLQMTNQQAIHQWIHTWEQSPNVAYIQLNQQVQISAQPDDPHYVSQSYLQQIHVEKAWDRVTSNNQVVIAIVDTGIDLTHPDLRHNLVTGKNLLQEHLPPQDDNGHGTSLAGVIGARGNNGQGISGMLWQTKMMPIKALNENGTGDESKLGQGIRYAVDHGANIVLLSLGLYKYSPFMQDVVQYAEDRGVLLVAAAGNDGKDVKYPAAYPTVLAVGGINAHNLVVADSNYGPELDIVAPWTVYTTMLDGEYGHNKGTSMAAPQVAAVAAMIWAIHPHLKPYEIRDHIRRTAETLGTQQWDPHAGFGLLRADLAVHEPPQSSLYSDHQTRENAAPLSVRTYLTAQLKGPQEENWYTLSAPYEGTITLQLTGDQQHLAQMQLTYYDGHSNNGTTMTDLSEPLSIDVQKGLTTIQIKGMTDAAFSTIDYQILTDFLIYRDAFEDNDRQFKAYVIPPDIQTVVGTFHQINDEDWFVLPVEQSGTLRLTGSMNTNRIDLELLVFKQGERIKLTDFTDSYGEGRTEYTRTINVQPGKYYIRARNVIAEQSYPATGEYTLHIDYEKKYIDPNEPNNRAFQATTMTLQETYHGVLTDDDTDWFSFRLPQQSYVSIDLTNIPVDRMMTLTLLNSNQKQLVKETNTLGERSIGGKQMLAGGTYYIQLTANQSFDYQMYQLEVSAEQLVAGYRDILGHWAEDEIVQLTEDQIIQGYDNHLFRPDHSITRAEAVKVITQAFGLTDRTSQKPLFSDVSLNHWAYEHIAIAAEAGVIHGYPDGTFHPDQTTTRVEMAVMIANALRLKESAVEQSPFSDVDKDHWAAALLTTMKNENWVTGFPDGTYKPLQLATRAEFVAFIARMIR